jgi:uncharacterized protein YyaL (SSP411 family)
VLAILVMKRILFILLVLSSLSFTEGENQTQELHWYHWNEGFVKAQQEGKIALIDVYTDWCGWCKRMDKDTYAKQGIIDQINAHFVPIKFNPEVHNGLIVGPDTMSGNQLLGALSRGNHSGFPTTYFYIPQKNHMLQYGGYQDSAKFSRILDEVLATSLAPIEKAPETSVPNK